MYRAPSKGCVVIIDRERDQATESNMSVLTNKFRIKPRNLVIEKQYLFEKEHKIIYRPGIAD